MFLAAAAKIWMIETDTKMWRETLLFHRMVLYKEFAVNIASGHTQSLEAFRLHYCLKVEDTVDLFRAILNA